MIETTFFLDPLDLAIRTIRTSYVHNCIGTFFSLPSPALQKEHVRLLQPTTPCNWHYAAIASLLLNFSTTTKFRNFTDQNNHPLNDGKCSVRPKAACGCTLYDDNNLNKTQTINSAACAPCQVAP